ncbi:hypothetical protein JAAARDRAFT_46197 [Jaapia argillacea MUCL 33604]|uniref:Uncharacterized protein n=1 Tax=Jaapia argillacea MUCL 33604 TaxID=933084 RepID=A0A067PX62_9AGAM|nr:hypothetical protein JAAARDRAFT_46197 [Jaapia argillacea MUCL 33604]
MSHIRSSPSNPVGFDTNGFIESLFFQVRQLKTQASNLHAENQRLHQILVELDLQVKFERGKYAKLVTTVEGTVFSITSRLGNLARQTCAEFAQPQSQGLASVASMNGGQMDEQENETPSHTNLSVTPEMGFEVSSSPESINSGEQKVQSSPSTSQMGMDVDVSEGPPAVKRSRHGGKAKAMAPLIAEVVHKLEGSNGSDRAAGKRRGKQRANFVKNLGRGLEENAQGEQLPEELLVDIDSRPSSHGFLESTDGPPAATLPRIVVLDFDLEEGPNQGRQFTSSPLPRHLSPRNSDMHEDLINFSAGEEDPMASNRLSIATDVTDLDLQTLADRKEEPFPTIPAISLEAYNSVLGNHTSGSADRNHDQRSQPNESLVDLETDDWFVDDRSESSDRDLIVDVDELGEGDALPGDDDEDNDGGEDEGDDEADDKFRRWTPPRGPGSRGVDALPHRRVPVEPLRRTAPEIQRSAVHERWLHRSPIATASLLDSTMRSDRLLSPIHELQGTPAPSNVAPSRRNVQASGNLEDLDAVLYAPYRSATVLSRGAAPFFRLELGDIYFHRDQ